MPTSNWGYKWVVQSILHKMRNAAIASRLHDSDRFQILVKPFIVWYPVSLICTFKVTNFASVQSLVSVHFHVNFDIPQMTTSKIENFTSKRFFFSVNLHANFYVVLVGTFKVAYVAWKHFSLEWIFMWILNMCL